MHDIVILGITIVMVALIIVRRLGGRNTSDVKPTDSRIC